MKIQTRKEGGVCVVELHGKLAQPDGTAALRSKVRELDDAGDHRLVFDLRNVPWLDSSGVGEIVGCHTRAADQGGEVRLVLPEKPLSEFSFTQLGQILKSYPTTEEAVASFADLADG